MQAYLTAARAGVRAGAKRRALDELEGYFSRQREHLGYAARLALGQSIGSGLVEGACKQVIGRPILYKTTKDFLLRFGLKDVSELPSMEEFEKMAGDTQGDLLTGAVADATGVPDVSDASDSNTSSHEESEATSEELPHASGDS